MKNYTFKDITEIGILVGLALLLNFSIFTIHIMGDAGSISFSLIPLFIIALRKSWWKTLIACSVVYGLIACLMDGYGFMTYPLDYFLGYGFICVLSFFHHLIFPYKKQSYLFITIGILISTILRLVFATISGIIIYEYNLVASLIYNTLYILLTGLVSCIAVLIIFKSLHHLLENK